MRVRVRVRFRVRITPWPSFLSLPSLTPQLPDTPVALAHAPLLSCSLSRSTPRGIERMHRAMQRQISQHRRTETDRIILSALRVYISASTGRVTVKVKVRLGLHCGPPPLYMYRGGMHAYSYT
jgi:hypothetical protein